MSEIITEESEDKLNTEALANPPLKAPSLPSKTKIQKRIHELELRQIELESENDILRIAASKHAEIASAGYFTLSKLGDIIEIDLKSGKTLGKEHSTLKNSRFDSFVSKDTLSVFQLFIENAFQSKKQQVCELTLSNNGNLLVNVLLTGIVTNNEELCNVNMVDITERKHMEENIKTLSAQLQGISEIESLYIRNVDPKIIFDRVLKVILEITASEYGFVGKVFYNSQREPYLKTLAITNISWDEDTRRFYDENAPQGLEFRKLKSLFGEVLLTGEPVISNAPNKDIRRGGLPNGHPPLNAFLGLPVYSGNELVGMMGVSNRVGGYDETIVEFVQPLLTSFSSIMVTMQSIAEKEKAEEVLLELKNKQSAMISNISDVICIVGKDGIVKYESPNVEKWFGWQPEELIGSNYLLTVHPDDMQRIQKVLSTLLKKGNLSKKVEYLYKCKNGHYKPIQLSVTNLLDNPAIDGLLLNFHEITERKHAQQALADNERFLQAIIDTEPECIKLLDINGNLLMMNRAGLEMVEADSFEQVKGQCICPLVTEPYRDAFLALLKHVFKGGSGTLEFETVGLKGGHIWLDTHAVPFKNDKDEIVALLGITRNMTERKYIEGQLLIRQRMDSLGTLVGGISHDFNNILGALAGNLDLLSQYNENFHEKQQKFLENAKKSTNRAIELTKQFQSLSSIRHSDKTTIDVYDIAKEVFGLLEATTNRLIKKEVQFNKGEFLISANSGDLHQVLLNLATNSIHAIEERKVTSEDYIRLNAEDFEVRNGNRTGLIDGDYIHFSFSDSGCGMSDEVLIQAFDPMFTTKDIGSKRGQGLGLAVVYNIITKHNHGVIEIASKINEGTTFHIYLPKAQSLINIDTPPKTIVQKGGAETLLLVDDDELVLSVVKDMLEALGYPVLIAINGKEALKIYTRNINSIAAVILDLNMPEMSGKEVFEEMFKINPNVSVIISSGYGDKQIQQGGLVGTKAILSKPYRLEDLNRVIRHVLGS
ncbi:PAS domain S-box protein [Paraglaciecola sp. 25GB23A]|uniref:PAS domain S-box protein n=1 Tax=Paraglaciecola sp. 25GB23A TaxID=3156068 RepID=UPI0032AEF502